MSTIEENGIDESETVTKIIQKRVERQELFEEDSDGDEFSIDANENGENGNEQQAPHYFVRTQATEDTSIEEVEQIHPLQQKARKN